MVVSNRIYVCGRKNGSPENLCPVVCSLFDASTFVDFMKKLHDEVFDYVVIAPEVHFQTNF